MTNPTNKPSSAELRACTACFYEGFGTLNPDKSLTLTIGPTNREGIVRCLLAGADAMDSLAAMRAQRDRLAHSLSKCADALESMDDGLDLDPGLVLVYLREARAALAELEGGAS